VCHANLLGRVGAVASGYHRPIASDGSSSGTLALFDIDGTLLEAPSRIHARAIEDASLAVYGVKLEAPREGADALEGMTSPLVARMRLREAGLTDADIDPGWPAWREAMIRTYLELQRSLPEQRPFADAEEALETLVAAGVGIGLLTGNFRAVAEAKLRVAGAWHDAFDLAQGAFGDDAEERDELGRVARRRAGPGTLLVIIGDTPRDVACARTASARAIAVATGGFPRDALADADLVAGDLAETTAALIAWDDAARRASA
jgi:phosphoglycolate phosphatase